MNWGAQIKYHLRINGKKDGIEQTGVFVNENLF